MSRFGDWLRGSDIELKALSATPAVLDSIGDAAGWSPYPILGGTNLDRSQLRAAQAQAQSGSYGYLYASQPAVRTVVDYIARNVSQLGLKLYERRSDTERVSRGDHPAARTMRSPNPTTPTGAWIFALVADFLVYDNAYALKLRNGQARSLLTLPPPMVGVIGDNRFTVDAYRVWRIDGTYFDVDPADIIHWRGYNPDDPRLGVSKLETLRKVLVEEAVSQAASTELAKNGLQNGYIKRPLDAPDWSDPARTRFEEDWANRRRNASRRNPVLEEGMEFVELGLSPKDAQLLDGRRFTLETVARIYGLASVPAKDEEERRQFYADVLPPITESLAEVLDLGLLQAEYDETDLYFEFNLDEKLRGNVEEKMAKLVSAAGAPFMTRDEVRAMQNLPPLPDGQGEEIITPMNVTVGGKPSVNEMPVQDPNGPPQDGSFREASARQIQTKSIEHRDSQARRRDEYAIDLTKTLQRHFRRQENAAKAKDTKFKAADEEKWNRELADDLYKAFKRTIQREGGIAAARFGLADFTFERVEEWLRKSAEAKAIAVNVTTQREIADEKFEDVWQNAKDNRAPSTGLAFATTMTAFAHREAAKQTPDAQQRVKTWVVTSAKSRHPEMHGETVPLFQQFSNGLDYPGGGSADESAGCQCILEIT